MTNKDKSQSRNLTALECLEIENEICEEIVKKYKLNYQELDLIKKTVRSDYEAFDRMHRVDGTFTKSRRSSEL